MLHYYDAGLLPRSWKTIRRFYGYAWDVIPPYAMENWAYTVPTGRKAILVYVFIHSVRTVASSSTNDWGAGLWIPVEMLLRVHRFNPYKDAFVIVAENFYLPFNENETVTGGTWDYNVDGRVRSYVHGIFLEL